MYTDGIPEGGSDSTEEYKMGYRAESEGLTWWNNPFAEKDWLKAALWWQGYSYARHEIHTGAQKMRSDRFLEIQKIVNR